LKLAQIYGAIAFYLDHRAEVRQYLEEEERRIQESTVPLSEANPELLEPAPAGARGIEQAEAMSVRFG